MNTIIQKLKDIWSIGELRDRIIYTIMLLAAYRLGTYILLPGIEPDKIMNLQNSGGQSNSLLGILNAFTGGAFSKMSIFALGIMPYISASIIVQLLGFAFPYFTKLQQEGESGTKKLNQITRALTVVVTLLQSSAYLSYQMSMYNLQPSVPTFLFTVTSAAILTAGTLFCMWLGERITDRGLGNGTSLLIMIGIVANFPAAILSELDLRLAGAGGGMVIFVLELAFFVLVCLATIALVQAVRRIPLQYARSMMQRGKVVTDEGDHTYLPIKVNTPGVMPIIFAQALMFVPSALVSWAGSTTGLMASLNDYRSIPYNLLYFTLIFVFTYVYTALVVNPQQYAESLARQNAFIPGVKPGADTAEFIDLVTTRITFPGAIMLGLIAILPSLAALLGVGPTFSMFFGGTSLIIMVGVILDTLAQVNNYLLENKYDGLIKGGQLKGRTELEGSQV